MSQSIWIIRSSHFDKESSRTSGDVYARDARTAASKTLNEDGKCDILKAEMTDTGDVISERCVVSSYPGHAPDDWHPHRYSPQPTQTMTDRHVPLGGQSFIQSLNQRRRPKKPTLVKNEVEAAMDESDLTASEVEHVMGLFPDMNRIFTYLKEEGQWKTIQLVQNLLTF